MNERGRSMEQFTLWRESARQETEALIFRLHALEAEVATLRQALEAREATVQALQARLAALERRIALLHATHTLLEVQPRAAAGGDDPWRTALTKRLREIVALVHPDKWHGSPVAHEATAALLALRDDIQAGPLAWHLGGTD